MDRNLESVPHIVFCVSGEQKVMSGEVECVLMYLMCVGWRLESHSKAHSVSGVGGSKGKAASHYAPFNTPWTLDT